MRPPRSPSPKLAAAGLCAVLFFTAAPPAGASEPANSRAGDAAPAARPTEILVRFRDKGAAALPSHLGRLSKSPHVAGIHKLELGAGLEMAEALADLRGRPEVLYAEPNLVFSTQVTEPNDPSFTNQWGLQKIGAPQAWDEQKGSRDVVLAVIDTGIDRAHPGLQENLWSNSDEIPDNNLDDDANGYVDDAAGWDFINGDNNPADGQGHGTHVAGIAAATGNDGIGTTGTAWASSVMAVKALDDQGSGTTLDIARGINYAVANGARVVNMSLGGDSYSRTLASAITGAPNTLFIVAAGNGGEDGVGDDTATHSSFPCNLSAANLLCVAATDGADALAGFSNYGSYVDLAAPGTRILSTIPGNRYSYASGTSMATPFVAGAAALVWSAQPGYSVAQVRSAITTGVEKIAGLENKVRTGGRLHLPGALGMNAAEVPAEEPEPAPTATPAPSPTPEPTPTPTPTPTPSASPTPATGGGGGGGGGLPLPSPTLTPLPTQSPLPQPTAAPSEQPTAEPTAAPTPVPSETPVDVPLEPEPEPAPPASGLGFDVQKKRTLKVHGALSPGSEGTVQVVLAKRKDGAFRKIATRSATLEVIDDNLAIFTSSFRRPRDGRCRITTIFTSATETTTARRTFTC